MSTRPTAIDADHEANREVAHFRTLFKAHLSPAFERIARTAGEDALGREPTPSVPTCEKVPTISGTISETGASYPETADEVGHISDATEAIRAALAKDRPTQRKVIELIKQNEVAHAGRLATCGRKSVELACGDCGGSEFVPMHCDSRLCPTCGKRKMGRVAQQYKGEVHGWEHPTMLRLSLPKRVEPDVESLTTALDALRGAFGRLRRRKVPPSGDPEDGAGWEWEEWQKYLRMVGERDLAARLRTQYVNRGKWVPVEEVLRGGFYAVDIKQGDDRTLNVHLHILADCPWLPQAALSKLWDDIIDAPVVDVRRVDSRGDQDAESAVMETIAYAAKAPEYQDVEDEVAYFRALKGSKLVQPFGSLHGNTPGSDELQCSECEGVPLLGWEYLGVVDERPGVVGSSADGDRPPPVQ